MDPIQISGKNLGQFSLPDSCPRCLWIRLHLRFRAPWSIFPGVFSSFDCFQKNVLSLYWQQHRRLPVWLHGFRQLGEPIAVPHHSKFRILDGPSEVTLTGAPDFMFRRFNKTVAILDGKTARLTEGQDDLAPLYATQLNSYAYIAERLGVGKITLLGLVYFEPQTAVDAEHLEGVVSETGFGMQFGVMLKPVPQNLNCIPALLMKVRELYEMRECPVGRSGCRDCELLARLLAVSPSLNPVC